MRIRKRITRTFTLLFAFLIGILCLIVYFTAKISTSNQFTERLNERIKISEEFLLESNSFSEEVRNNLRDKFLNFLPEEIEYADTLENFNFPNEFADKLPASFLEDLKSKKELEWTLGDMQGIAKIYDINQIQYVVLVVAKNIHGLSQLKQLRNILLISFIITLCITFFISQFFAISVLKPIGNIIEKANAISAANLDSRLTVNNEQDELDMIAKSFNELLDRLQTSFELEKNFVRYASHELKNPLAVILGEAEVALMKDRSPNEYIQTVRKITSKAEQINSLVDHFLQISKLENAELNSDNTKLDEVLMEIAFKLAQQEENQDKITFNICDECSAEDFELVADTKLLHTALFNIVENACKFSQDEEEVIINLSKENNKIVISIQDKGIGIAEDQLKNIFKPLYRGGNAHGISGRGIGLALVKRIIELHKGEITVTSVLDEGTEFIILI